MIFSKKKSATTESFATRPARNFVSNKKVATIITARYPRRRRHLPVNVIMCIINTNFSRVYLCRYFVTQIVLFLATKTRELKKRSLFVKKLVSQNAPR